MSTEFQRRQRIVGALSLVFAVLIVAVGLESYALIHLNEKMHEDEHANATSTVTKKADSGVQADQSIASHAGSPSFDDPFAPGMLDDWFQTPLDPNTRNPLAEMHRLQQRMDRMFEGSFGHFNASPILGNKEATFTHIPRMDLHEDNDSYIVRFDLPGMVKSNINVRLEDRTLTVSGTREENLEKKEGHRVLESEVIKGQFERSLLLPGPVKSGNVTATYKDGVLKVTVPKGNGPAMSSEHIEVK